VNPAERGSRKDPNTSLREEISKEEAEGDRLQKEAHYRWARVEELRPLLREQAHLTMFLEVAEAELASARARTHRLQAEAGSADTVTESSPSLAAAEHKCAALREQLNAVELRIAEDDAALRTRYEL
jgi:hypothetical protein